MCYWILHALEILESLPSQSVLSKYDYILNIFAQHVKNNVNETLFLVFSIIDIVNVSLREYNFHEYILAFASWLICDNVYFWMHHIIETVYSLVLTDWKIIFTSIQQNKILVMYTKSNKPVVRIFFRIDLVNNYFIEDFIYNY